MSSIQAQMRGTAPTARVVGDRLLLQDPGLFEADGRGARRLIERAFALAEVRTIVVTPHRGLISIRLEPLSASQAVWDRLGALLRQSQPSAGERTLGADRLPLAAPAPGVPVRIHRAGRTLTTFKVRSLSIERMRIAHPLLRTRDVRRRVVELLRSTHGVIAARSVRLWASVVVEFDADLIDPERLLRLLDSSWPHFVDNRAAMPPPRKLAVAGALLTLSFTAQFIRPALMPWAIGAVALYSLGNVRAALRDLRHGRIGLPAMYSVSLGFMLWTGLPFASSLIATLIQFWPALMTAISLRAERRLFAEHHRQVASARVALGPGRAVRVDIGDVAPGAIVWAHKDDYIPVDGIIVDGTAAIDQTILTGARGAVDRAVGDVVYAGSVVRDGAIAVRTERVGSTTSGSALSRVLPQGKLSGLPSLTAVEQVANRNAKPALIAAGLLLLATRTPRLSQVAIRPDYATGPRLSTHLSALSAIAESLSGGALIRNAASLDRIMHADVCVFDDGAYFTRRAVSVSNVFRDDRSTVKDLVALGASALAGRDDPRGHALQLEAQRLGVSNIHAREHRRVAGAILFRDDSGSLISVSTPEFALRSALAASTRRVDAALRAGAVEVAPPEGRSLVVARDREILGVIAFDRLGPPIVANAVNALRNEIPGIRFVHLSGASQEDAEARADALGLDAVFGRLNPAAKAEAIRSLGGNVIWIGNGRDRAAMAPRSASAVSVSVAGLQNLPGDAADIALLSGDPGDLVVARRAAKSRLGGMRSDYRVVYFANLAAVAGGFAAGFGSLQAGLASNLGTAAVFLSRWRDLNRLAARTEQAAQARRLVSPGSAGALDDRYDLFPPTPAQSDVRPEQTLRN